MSARRYEINMSQGSIFKNILRFSIPLMLTSILQLLYNAADIIVVSRWAGNEAMAAVGATSSLNNLIISVFMGMSLGSSVVVSRKYGARDSWAIHRAVHTSMTVGIIAGICAALLGEIFSKPLLVMMGTPEGTVLDGASYYMRIIYLGVPASLIYNFASAIMRAVGDTKRPLYILTVTGIVNVVLNLILVICFDMSVAGVAIATVVSNYLSAAAVLYFLIRSDSLYRLNLKQLKIYKEELIEIIKIGLPAGLQGSVFNLSNMVVQSAINSFGTAAIAGGVAVANIEGFIYVSLNSLYQATITCVSQNYGAKNEKRINKAIYIPILCVCVLGLALSTFVLIFSNQLLSIYITDSPSAMDFAQRRVLITIMPQFLVGTMEVLCGVLRGLGYSTITAINSFIGACGVRILWVLVILPLYKTIDFLYLCWPISWTCVIFMHIITLLIVKKRAIKRMYEE